MATRLAALPNFPRFIVSIRESTRRTRDRWPLEFDLEGVPRATGERERLLEQKRALESSTLTQEDFSLMQGPTNQFAVDYQQANSVMDINNPPRKPYVFQEYPKCLYSKNGSSILVDGKEQEQKKLKEGYSLKPFPPKAEAE